MLTNMSMTLDGDILIVRIALNGKAKPSKKFSRSRNMVVASTNGSKPLVAADGSFRPELINCSVFRKHDPEIDGPEPPDTGYSSW